MFEDVLYEDRAAPLVAAGARHRLKPRNPGDVPVCKKCYFTYSEDDS